MLNTSGWQTLKNKIAIGTYSLSGPQSRSDRLEKRIIFYPLRELNYESSDIETVAYSLYRLILLSSCYILEHTHGKLKCAKFLLKSLRTFKKLKKKLSLSLIARNHLNKREQSRLPNCCVVCVVYTVECSLDNG